MTYSCWLIPAFTVGCLGSGDGQMTAGGNLDLGVTEGDITRESTVSRQNIIGESHVTISYICDTVKALLTGSCIKMISRTCLEIFRESRCTNTSCSALKKRND